jgi:hypothetical protein
LFRSNLVLYNLTGNKFNSSNILFPFDIQENVDWVIFDKENELLKEWKYQNQPWFSPHDGKHIQSIFFGVAVSYWLFMFSTLAFLLLNQRLKKKKTAAEKEDSSSEASPKKKQSGSKKKS